MLVSDKWIIIVNNRGDINSIPTYGGYFTMGIPCYIYKNPNHQRFETGGLAPYFTKVWAALLRFARHGEAGRAGFLSHGVTPQSIHCIFGVSMIFHYKPTILWCITILGHPHNMYIINYNHTIWFFSSILYDTIWDEVIEFKHGFWPITWSQHDEIQYPDSLKEEILLDNLVWQLVGSRGTVAQGKCCWKPWL